jgi:hypothetical protein
MKSLTYTALQEATREGERARGGQQPRRRPVHQGGGGALMAFPSWGIMIKLPPLGSLYIVGRWCTFPLPKQPREAATGGSKGGSRQAG